MESPPVITKHERMVHRIRTLVIGTFAFMSLAATSEAATGSCTIDARTDGATAHCLTAVTNPGFPEDLTQDSPFSSCAHAAPTYLACRADRAPIEVAYVFLGAAFFVGHVHPDSHDPRGQIWAERGWSIATHILDAEGPTDGRDDERLATLRYVLVRANNTY